MEGAYGIMPVFALANAGVGLTNFNLPGATLATIDAPRIP